MCLLSRPSRLQHSAEHSSRHYALLAAAGSMSRNTRKVRHLAPAQLQAFDARGGVRGCALDLALAERPQPQLLSPQLRNLPRHLHGTMQFVRILLLCTVQCIY